MTAVDTQAVEAVNARFYRALSKADAALMDAVWSHSHDVACLHPGWPLCVVGVTCRPVGMASSNGKARSASGRARSKPP